MFGQRGKKQVLEVKGLTIFGSFGLAAKRSVYFERRAGIGL